MSEHDSAFEVRATVALAVLGSSPPDPAGRRVSPILNDPQVGREFVAHTEIDYVAANEAHGFTAHVPESSIRLPCDGCFAPATALADAARVWGLRQVHASSLTNAEDNG